MYYILARAFDEADVNADDDVEDVDDANDDAEDDTEDEDDKLTTYSSSEKP